MTNTSLSDFPASLVVDLDAIVGNWRYLSSVQPTASCAAVVKANAYGLGAGPVASALAVAGCMEFFVASWVEGAQLRKALGACPTIYVLNGALGDDAQALMASDLVPVLNSLGQLAYWSGSGNGKACALMVDTGMSRLGLSVSELLASLQVSLKGLNAVLLLSHLACSDDPAAAKNADQQQAFEVALAETKRQFPNIRASLASTAGIFLGQSYAYDVLRPGVGLYGASPNPYAPQRQLLPVVQLGLQVVQLRATNQSVTVGYGASQSVPAGRVLATVCGGYADGLLRSLSGRGYGFCRGVKVPLVGRVSMDYCVFDVTDAGLSSAEEVRGLVIEVLGKHQTLDDMACQADTIGYELLTGLGARYRRQYIGGGA